LRLLRENSKQVEKLVEHNARWADEVERCREVSSRVEGLEKENKRLAGELSQRLKQQHQDLGTPRLRLQFEVGLKSAPGPGEPPSSAARIEFDESKMVTREKHQSLIAKYNNLCEKYTDLKDAKKKIHDMLVSERNKIKDWSLYAKDQEKTINQKNDKIQRLEEEIQRLRALSKGHRVPSTPLLESEDQAGENAVHKSPMLLERGSDVQVAVSSPVKATRLEIAATEREVAGQTSEAVEAPVHHGNSAPEDVDLPPHRDTAAVFVEDTEFEPIEPHNTSSTEGTSDPFSPDRVPGHGQAAEENPTTEDPASPGYEFISCRSVKKRKVRHENTDKKIKSEIKVETIGSSPISIAAFRILNPNESLDLDDIGEKVDTPRKQRRVLEFPHQALNSISYSPQSARILSQNKGHRKPTDREGPRNSSQETPVRHEDSVLQPRSTNRQILPRTSDDRAAKKRRIASEEAVGELAEDGEIATAARSRRQTSDSNDRLDVLLAKPSPPKKVLSPARIALNQQARPSKVSATSSLAHELQLTPQEDADLRRLPKPNPRPPESHPSSSRGLGRESAETSRPSSKGSLSGSAESLRPSSRSTLLGSEESSRPTSKGTSRGSVEPLRPTSKSTPRGSLEPLEFSVSNESGYLPPRRPPLASTYFAKQPPRTPSETPRPPSRQNRELGRTSTVKSRRLHQDSAATNWAMGPNQEPLRVRPVNRLNLHDFKVNPNYNQGYEYAFKDVVRDQTARKCLRGCTKPECCGHKFRALVEINRNTGVSPTSSQEEANEMLLDEFMGDNAYKLRNMSKAEKEEMLVQAKTRQLANKYGKHRHAYERRTSPPGFWRTDFPTTQEEMEDREKAKEKARDDVAQRYKEAMRPGGAFIFRDE